MSLSATIRANVPLEMTRGFKIYNPYTDKYGVGAKPNRAFVTLDKAHAVVLRVEVK